MRQFRWAIGREDRLYRERGLALTFRRGCTGTTYGETGSNEFLEVKAVLFWWSWVFRADWKGNRYD